MRLNTIQVITNASTFMSLVFIPLYADRLGATHTQIGIIGAVYGIALFISSYAFGRIADAYSPKRLLYIGFAVSTVFFFLQVFADTPERLIFIRTLAGFSAGIFPAALISYIHTLERNIGKFSSYGALGWTLGALIAGIIANLKGIFLISSIFFLIAFVLLHKLPDAKPSPQKSDFFSSRIIKKNWNLYVTYFARHLGACSVWIILPLYMYALGAREFEIGLIYALNPISQFLIMRRLKTHNSEKFVKMGHLASILSFATLYFITSYYYIIFTMLIVAVSWSFLYVGSIDTLLKHNTNKATAVGLLTSVISIAAVTGSFVGGSLSDFTGNILSSQLMGYRIVCGFAAIICTISFMTYKTTQYKNNDYN